VAELLGGIGFGAFLAVSAGVGIRLLLLARRTRELPELAIGLNFVLAGALGYALLLAAESLRLLPQPQAGWASLLGVTAISVGAVAIGVFSRRVFRPGGAAATLGLALLIAWLALGVYGSWVLHVQGSAQGAGGWLGRWAPNLGMVAAYAWSSYEPLRYHVLLRRRLRIGIGDPLIANRLLLWGIGTGAVTAVTAIHLVAQLRGHNELPHSLVGPVSLLVLCAAVAEWLAFFPPAAYRRRFAAPSTSR
jgi:hypothetical protein